MPDEIRYIVRVIIIKAAYTRESFSPVAYIRGKIMHHSNYEDSNRDGGHKSNSQTTPDASTRASAAVQLELICPMKGEHRLLRDL